MVEMVEILVEILAWDNAFHFLALHYLIHPWLPLPPSQNLIHPWGHIFVLERHGLPLKFLHDISTIELDQIKDPHLNPHAKC